MTEEFRRLISAAVLIGGDYATGYQRGMRRRYHGENFGTDAEHEKWLSMGLDGDHRADLGQGYRDGLDGRPPRNGGASNSTSRLHIECASKDKAGWVKTAKSDGMKLSKWVIKTLNDASKFKNGNK